MATQAARRAVQARTVIGAALVAGAMALATPASIAAADPSTGPNDVVGPIIADYNSRINDLMKQFNADVVSGRVNNQQLILQLTAASNELQESLLAAIPAGR
jgi:hypothetical protein